MLGSDIILSPVWAIDALQANAFSTQLAVDAANEQVAFRYIPPEDMTITDVAMRFTIGGTTTGITVIMEWQTETVVSATVAYPSGTVVGAATSAFAVPTSSGWIALQALGSSATLTRGTPYWLVVRDGGGTAPTASNWWAATRYGGSSSRGSGHVTRHYNGTNWTTTSSVTSTSVYHVKTSTGRYVGFPVETVNIYSSTAVYGTTRVGSTLPCLGVPYEWHGVVCGLGLVTSGSPASFEFEAWVNGELCGVTAANSSAQKSTCYYFPAPVRVPARANAIAAVHQVGDGGDSGNRYLVVVLDVFAENVESRAALGVSQQAWCMTAASRTAAWTCPDATHVSCFWPVIKLASEDFLATPQLRTRPGRLVR